MIFINGVQLRGVAAHNVLHRTITELAQENPQPVLNAIPDSAREKHLADWRLQNVRQQPPDIVEHAMGDDQPTLEILVYGDYLTDPTFRLDRTIRGLMQGRDDVRYVFRHYPIHPKCNPNIKTANHELTCEASLAVEAAVALGGEEAYWNMHGWIMDHQAEFTLDSISQGAEAIGLDPYAVLAKMQDAKVIHAIREDADAGALHRPRSVPVCFVNGKFVPRPFFGDKCIIDDIASEVLGEDVRQD